MRSPHSARGSTPRHTLKQNFSWARAPPCIRSPQPNSGFEVAFDAMPALRTTQHKPRIIFGVRAASRTTWSPRALTFRTSGLIACICLGPIFIFLGSAKPASSLFNFTSLARRPRLFSSSNHDDDVALELKILGRRRVPCRCLPSVSSLSPSLHILIHTYRYDDAAR